MVALPKKIIAGDTLEVRVAAGDYTAGVLYLENASTQVSISGSLVGDEIVFAANAATTGAYAAGRYRASIRLNDGTSYETVAQEWVDIVLDPAKAGAQDPRSWARRVLDALQATLEGRATSEQQSMSIAGRSISRLSPSEILATIKELEQRVAVEEAGSRAGLGRFVRIRAAGGL